MTDFWLLLEGLFCLVAVDMTVPFFVAAGVTDFFGCCWNDCVLFS